MFDIGFWELVLVGVVSLLVFGPERLPKVAREAALWVRRARAMANSVKQEIDQELQLEELRQSLLEEKRKVELLSSSVRHGRKQDHISTPLPDDAVEKPTAPKDDNGEL